MCYRGTWTFADGKVSSSHGKRKISVTILKKGFYRFVHGFGKTAFCFQKLKMVLLKGKVF
jgi:hypothetical protein